MYGEIHCCLGSSAFLLFKRLLQDPPRRANNKERASISLMWSNTSSPVSLTRNKPDQARVILVTVAGLIKDKSSPSVF